MYVLTPFFTFLAWSVLSTYASLSLSSVVFASPTFHMTTAIGKWIAEKDGSLMEDPQTSGLTFFDGHLYAISDGSAKLHQLRTLHKLSVETGQVVEKIGPIQLAQNIANNSCFADYLESRPDYEGLVKMPISLSHAGDDTVSNNSETWFVVTEDASRGNKISHECLVKYAEANFTHFPSLLIKIELVDKVLMVTGVRALQFDANDNVDKRLIINEDIENDGIEGIAITQEGKILLGLERDAVGKPRVFELDYAHNMFETIDEFVKVRDSGLRFPNFTSFKNPINGMDVYYPIGKSTGFLITAARNANQLWILDLAKQKPAIMVDLNLYAPSDTSKGCAPIHKIRNTALEGVAVHGHTLYLINDPWKQEYPKNIICAQDKPRYEGQSPLLFTLPIDAAWFN